MFEKACMVVWATMLGDVKKHDWWCEEACFTIADEGQQRYRHTSAMLLTFVSKSKTVLTVTGTTMDNISIRPIRTCLFFKRYFGIFSKILRWAASQSQWYSSPLKSLKPSISARRPLPLPMWWGVQLRFSYGWRQIERVPLGTRHHTLIAYLRHAFRQWTHYQPFRRTYGTTVWLAARLFRLLPTGRKNPYQMPMASAAQRVGNFN